MGQFIFNPASGTPREQQWRRHLQEQEYTDDVVRVIDTSVKAYNERSKAIEEAVHSGVAQVSDTIATAAIAEIESARQNAAAIVGTVEMASDRVAAHIDALGRALDHRLAALLYQQSVSNLLLGDISQLMRIPDFQKERLYYTEQGLKHFANARTLDPSFYEEALEVLLKAEEREKTDYVVLYTIGMIHAYSPSEKLNNLAVAETYFLRAARYAAIESNPVAARLDSILWEDVTNVPESQKGGSKRAAAEAWMQAGFACYAQGKLADAVAHGRKAVEVDPTYLLARFNACKFLAADGRAADALKDLQDVIRADRYYSASTANDPDLATKPEVVALLEDLRKESKELLVLDAREINQRAVPFFGEGGDHHDQMRRISTALHDSRYLQILGALDQTPILKQKALLWEETLSAVKELDGHLDAGSPLALTVSRAVAELAITKTYSYPRDLRERMRAPDADAINVREIISELTAADSALRTAKARYKEAETALSRLRRVPPTGDGPISLSSLSHAKQAIADSEREISLLDYTALTNAQRNSEAAAKLANAVLSNAEAMLTRAAAEDAHERHRSMMRGSAKLLGTIVVLALWLAPGISIAYQGGCPRTEGSHWIPVINWLMFFMESASPPTGASWQCQNIRFGNFVLTVFCTFILVVASGWGAAAASEAANKGK